jgi:hypothetical protein
VNGERRSPARTSLTNVGLTNVSLMNISLMFAGDGNRSIKNGFQQQLSTRRRGR